MVIQLLVIYHNVKELSSALVRENIVLFYITIGMVSVAKNMVFLTDLLFRDHPSYRRDVPQPETAPLCRFATPPLRGDHTGHPHDDGRFCYRKR